HPFLDSLPSSPAIFGSNELGAIAEKIVFITTQDSAIAGVAQELSDVLADRPKFVFHVSGALSSSVLRPLSDLGIRVGSIHPLVAISDPVSGAARLRDARFCIEGDEEAVQLAKEIVAKLGGKSFSIDTKFKTLYHASAVISSGHFVALIDIATGLLGKCGMEKAEAKEVLLPLIESTALNIKEQSLSDALTGPFARADLETLLDHIDSLRENASPEELEIYLHLGDRSLSLAGEKQADQKRIDQMREIISDAHKSVS
ncbi:MAG: DUF2520 domain-containing protein, partial [Acidobacteria bacterium]|nr:DUF2520 domain-containing protein [Acidobacteriota bacterium]